MELLLSFLAAGIGSMITFMLLQSNKNGKFEQLFIDMKELFIVFTKRLDKVEDDIDILKTVKTEHDMIKNAGNLIKNHSVDKVGS